MIRKKLKSNIGASITFALLLFLVCSVVGSIILTSATAASGRLSGLAKSDERYYAVTSAAQLFRDALLGGEEQREMVVTREKAERFTTAESKNIIPQPTGGTADASAPGAVNPVYTFEINNAALNDSYALNAESFLT